MNFLTLLAHLAGLASSAAATNPSCRYIPGDAGWPDDSKWTSLNRTVHGQLIRTLPAGHVCHDPTYNEALCNDLRAKWGDPFFKTSLVEALLTPSFANNSCDPLGHRNDPCEIGGYTQYSINVTSPEDVAAGIAFARRHNVRIVVKNTGHDFLGRSSGFGSLSLWTHNLKSKQVIDNYKSKGYNGPALKVGAGVQVREANEFIDKHGYMMVGGECPSVGLSGGYTAGGGHGPLSSEVGLAADQTLEFEAITADGKLIRAAPDENEDLYWALSGGGPGYAVVWSATYRIFPDRKMVGTNLIFDKSDRKTADQDYWDVIEFWHSMAPNITDTGGYTYTGYNDSHFEMTPLFSPKQTREQVLALLKPLHDKLDSLGMKYTSNTTEWSGYLPAWREYFNWNEGGVQDNHGGSRLIPRKVILEKPKELNAVIRKLTLEIGAVQEMTIGVKTPSNNNNAVNPAWRDADIFFLISELLPEYTAAGIDDRLTHGWADLLREVAPNSGTYMNEADVYEVNWQQSFYGDHYPRLLEIKHKYDPHAVFYGTTMVGSEAWQRKDDGRLCRT